jgi:hypothetical protein
MGLKTVRSPCLRRLQRDDSAPHGDAVSVEGRARGKALKHQNTQASPVPRGMRAESASCSCNIRLGDPVVGVRVAW